MALLKQKEEDDASRKAHREMDPQILPPRVRSHALPLTVGPGSIFRGHHHWSATLRGTCHKSGRHHRCRDRLEH